MSVVVLGWRNRNPPRTDDLPFVGEYLISRSFSDISESPKRHEAALCSMIGSVGIRRRDLDVGLMSVRGSRKNVGLWRTTKTRSLKLGCPPVRKQRFQGSGFRDVALPRYQAFQTLSAVLPSP